MASGSGGERENLLEAQSSGVHRGALLLDSATKHQVEEFDEVDRGTGDLRGEASKVRRRCKRSRSCLRA